MNPVMVRPEGLGVAVADALITVAAETGQAGRRAVSHAGKASTSG